MSTPIAKYIHIRQDTAMHPYNVQQQKEAAVRYRKLKKLREAGLTLAQIGKLEECSRERVRQILKRGNGHEIT